MRLAALIQPHHSSINLNTLMLNDIRNIPAKVQQTGNRKILEVN